MNLLSNNVKCTHCSRPFANEDERPMVFTRTSSLVRNHNNDGGFLGNFGKNIFLMDIPLQNQISAEQNIMESQVR